MFSKLDCDIQDNECGYDIYFTIKYQDWKSNPVKYVEYLEENICSSVNVRDVAKFFVYTCESADEEENKEFVDTFRSYNFDNFFRLLRNIMTEKYDSYEDFHIKLETIMYENYELFYNLHHVATALIPMDKITTPSMEKFKVVQEELLKELNEKLDEVLPLK